MSGFISDFVDLLQFTKELYCRNDSNLEKNGPKIGKRHNLFLKIVEGNSSSGIKMAVKGISQRLFASRILNRSQGSLSDYLSKPPDQMPKTHGRAIWLTLDEFLQSKTQQDALVSEFKKGN